MSLRSMVVVIAVVLTGLVTVPPAGAAKWSTSDRYRDAPASIDIKRFSIDNGKRRITSVVRFHSLNRRQILNFHIGIATKKNVSAGQYFIRSERARAGKPLEHSLRYGLSATTKVKCKGLVVKWGRKKVSTKVPQKCLGRQAGKIRAYAFIYSLSDHWDMAPEELTKWLKRG